MKQLLQDLSSGVTSIEDVPRPRALDGHAVIATTTSLVSAGTERMIVEFGKANLLSKAMQQPEKVQQVLDKVRTDGLLTTYDAVQAKLSDPVPLGYCNVGTVLEMGEGLSGLVPGDRVVSNGHHAELVRVPGNLLAKIPDSVSDDEAAFVVMAAIGLQGVRLAAPTLGESVVVVGVGLIGLLTVQLLLAQGCKVLAVDMDASRLALAESYGATICNVANGEDSVAAGMAFSGGVGVDAVLITASTKSSDPVTNAARMSRKRGRIVLVGVTGLELNRGDFYEKELTFQVSCSYGPGRYDPEYEDKGHDYPVGFVRWTEQRNFEAILSLMEVGRIDVSSLISHRFDFEDAASAYEVLTESKSALGIMLKYASAVDERLSSEVVLDSERSYSADKPIVSFVGAGNYASRMLIPAFTAAGTQLGTIITNGGASSVIHGKKNGFAKASSDVKTMLADSSVNTVAIVTRHDSHAQLVVDSLESGKNVFVEKPLALTFEELGSIERCIAGLAENSPRLMVGFNRRFAPNIVKMQELLASVSEPKSFIFTMNAGAIPADHWVHDKKIGGGRIIGEACHYIDLMRHLAGSEIVSVAARRMGTHPAVAVAEDKASITLGFADGSFGTIHYFANGSSKFPKERIEVFTSGRVLQLDNFRKLSGFGWSSFKKQTLLSQDKGQTHCTKAFLHSIESGKASPISVSELLEVARVSIEVANILESQK